MGWFGKAIVGRWLGRWLLRGGPWSIAAKLVGVVVYGAWKWRREAKRVETERRSREIPAEYEVIEESGEAPGEAGRVPPPQEHGPSPRGTPGDRTIPSERPVSNPGTEDRPGGTG